jgi:hypothetical protein
MSDKRQKLDNYQVESSLTTCGTFTGSSALDFLVFRESWRAHMRAHGVEDIIVHGTECGRPIEELMFETPDRFAIIVEVQNDQEVEEKKKTFRESFVQMVEESPWLVYWWMSHEVPTARRCSPDPFTKVRRNYTVPTQLEFETVLDLLPLGHDGILGLPRSDLSVEHFPDVLDAPPVGNPALDARLLSITVFNQFASEMADLKTETLSWNVGVEREAMEQAGGRDIEEYVDELTHKNQNKVRSLFASRVSTHKESVNKLKDRYVKCAAVFNKIGTANLKSVQKELDECDFHGAYNKLVTIYVSKGIANTEDFENRAKSVVLQAGQSITDHWNCLSDALRRWATVLGYLQDLKDHVEVRGEPTYIPYCNPLEAEANSGTLRDKAIIDLGFRVHISESVRYRFLNNSLSQNTNRFKGVMDAMAALSLKKRFVKNYLDRLKVREDDQSGQDDINEEMNRINKDESNSNRKAMSAMNYKKPAGLFPPGSCKYHLTATSHNTSTCNSKSSSKSKKSLKPCEYCKKNHPELADGHPNEKCWSDENSPAFKGNRNAKVAIDTTGDKKRKPRKGGKKRKESQGQLTRDDFKTKSGYDLFNANQVQMHEFLKGVTVRDDEDSSEGK